MIIYNSTDRYNEVTSKAYNDVTDPYGYDYDKAFKRNLKQRIEFHLQDVAKYAYVGALTFNDKAISNKFEFVGDDDSKLIFSLPYNVHNIPAVQKFFKRLEEQCKRLFGANLQHTFVCEQGEGGLTHLDELIRKGKAPKRGTNNNPHVHFILYSNVYIKPTKLDVLIKYYWQGVYKDKVNRKRNASFTDKYRVFIRRYEDCRYGLAGLNRKVNDGMIDLSNSNSKYNTHTASGYLTNYLCKDLDSYEYKLKQLGAIEKQYLKHLGKTKELLTPLEEERLCLIKHRFSCQCLPRALHSIGVGSSAFLHIDNKYKVPTYRDKTASREALCSYCKRKYLYDHVAHPVRTTKAGKPLIVFIPNKKYIECKLANLDTNIETTLKTFRKLYDNYSLYFSEYIEYVRKNNLVQTPLSRLLSASDFYKMSIYKNVYEGRRYMFLDDLTANVHDDYQIFLEKDSLAGFAVHRLKDIRKELPYYYYSEHPYFSDIMQDYAELIQFGKWYRSKLSSIWLKKMKEKQQVGISQKTSLRLR